METTLKSLEFVMGADGNHWGPTRRLWHVIQGTRAAMGVVWNTRRERADAFRSEDVHAPMMAWARDMLHTLGVHFEVLGEGPPTGPCLMVGNHHSYLDITMLMAVTPVVFVAKRQLASWPVFGSAMRSVGTVFVERNSRDSRKGAADAIAPKILEEGLSVAVFPSGTTTLDEIKPWRWGAFVIAKRYGIPVQPFRIRYSPLRPAAFIGQDFFLSHMWVLARSPGGVRATIEFAKPFQVGDPQAVAETWWRWSREGL